MILLNERFPSEGEENPSLARFFCTGLWLSRDATAGLSEVSSKGLVER